MLLYESEVHIMKKTLIAYFTRTGITKKLAEDTAK